MIDEKKLLEWKMLLIADEPAPEDFHMKDVFEITFAALRVVRAAQDGILNLAQNGADDIAGSENQIIPQQQVSNLEEALAPFTEQEKK